MKKYKWLIILFNLVLLLGYFNYSVIRKENLLKDGQLILLQLAPVDPRSLMQGDYMTLRYAIAGTLGEEGIPKRGYCVVTLDKKGVAHKVRFQENKTPLKTGEHIISYTSGEWSINIGAESFFFQEGHARKYEAAVYGGIKTDKNGNSLLIGLYDKNLKKIN